MVWEVAKLVSLSVINSVRVSIDLMWHRACAGATPHFLLFERKNFIALFLLQ